MVTLFTKFVAAALEAFFNCNTKTFDGCAGLVYDIDKSVECAADCKEVVNDKNVVFGGDVFLAYVNIVNAFLVKEVTLEE